MSESDIVRDCLHILHVYSIFSWRNNSGARGKVRFGFPGSADIFAILPPSGQFLAIECKTETGKLSPGQELYLEAVKRAGGEALVIRDADELSDYLVERGV